MVPDETQVIGLVQEGAVVADETRQQVDLWRYGFSAHATVMELARPPYWKPGQEGNKANFSHWTEKRSGTPYGNGPLDITDVGR